MSWRYSLPAQQWITRTLASMHSRAETIDSNGDISSTSPDSPESESSTPMTTYISLIACVDRTGHVLGAGRDGEEAMINADIKEERLSDDVELLIIEVHNRPAPEFLFSEPAATCICDYFSGDSDSTPSHLQSTVRNLMMERLFADAVHFCINEIWDDNSIWAPS